MIQLHHLCREYHLNTKPPN